MQLWFIYALLSVLVIAGSEISQKISMTQKVNISSITNNFFVWTLQGFGGLILSILFRNFDVNWSIHDLYKLILVAIIYFIGGTYYYNSYKSNSLSISLIILNVSIIISTTLGIIFFKESTYITKFIGIFMILFAIFLVNYKYGKKFDKYNMHALIGGICFGIAYSLDKSFINNTSPMFYVSLLSFSVAIVSLLLKYKHITTEVKNLKSKNFVPIIMTSIFGTLFNTFTFLSYSKGGNVGTIDAMNNSSIFLIILFEIFIFKDKSNMKKKILGALIVTLGIALLSSTT